MLDVPGIEVLAESPDPLALTNLVTGGVIGAVGAVVAAIILGAFDWSRRRMRRAEQIVFVREFIVAQFTRIRDQKPMPPLPDGSPAPAVDEVNWLHYQNFLRDLEVILSHRLTMLDYGKTHKLRLGLTGQKHLVAALFETTGRRPNGTGYYRQRYDEFQKIEWLGLPSGLFPVANPQKAP